MKEIIAKPLRVETEDKIYELELGQMQVEITGRCNMQCEHCRADHEQHQDMPIDQILKIVRFFLRHSPVQKRIIVSGGEPLMHGQFFEVLRAIRRAGGSYVTLTTNGTRLTQEHLDLIRELKFERFMLSVSLDSLNEQEHNSFRNYPRAYEKAIEALRLMNSAKIPNVVTSIRSTIKPDKIDSISGLIKFAQSEGCNRINLSSIHPAGRAIERPDLWMTREQKKQFIEKIYEEKRLLNRSAVKGCDADFRIDTNDPLKCLARGHGEEGQCGEVVFDGCIAAAVTFNISVNGDMTPCALMNIPIMNVNGLSIKEITRCYQQSEIVKNMLEMNLKGKCGRCAKKFQCGGCRARALIRQGDYLDEDPDCWMREN